MTRALAKANPLPVSYAEAKIAIAKCAKVDECKDWADKAKALAAYHKQQKDKTLEHNAIRIRARAIKRAGVLLKEKEADHVPKRGKGLKGGRTPSNHSRKQAGHDAGMSDHDIKTALDGRGHHARWHLRRRGRRKAA